ncbi:MAG: hypothetical protein OES93_08555 [Gammaproteobacteria bacterium]|nr:hypothetical protein [Gammaproteobacteria bacterium]
MLNCRILLVTTLLLLTASGAPALEPGDADRLFGTDIILGVTITAPMKTLLGERPNDRYLRGTLSYEEADGSVVDFDIGIRTRGNFRRQRDVCSFPPLRINFKKSETKDTLFHKQNKLKLVAHCRDNSERYEQNIIKEFLAYRILNTLTDISYRVRLARITYRDSEQKYDDRLRYAFFIEHKKRLSRRVGLPVISTDRIKASDLEGKYSDLTSLFQFMIGNTDYSPIAGPEGEDCCHNSTLFGQENQPIYSVPYDFDMSGLVDAPYAEPNPRFRIKRVTQRHYRGRCAHINHLPASVQLFQDKRDAIYALFEEQNEMEDSTRKRVTKFIDRFYDVIGNSKKLHREIESQCI